MTLSALYGLKNLDFSFLTSQKKSFFDTAWQLLGKKMKFF